MIVTTIVKQPKILVVIFFNHLKWIEHCLKCSFFQVGYMSSTLVCLWLFIYTFSFISTIFFTLVTFDCRFFYPCTIYIPLILRVFKLNQLSWLFYHYFFFYLMVTYSFASINECQSLILTILGLNFLLLLMTAWVLNICSKYLSSNLIIY